MSVIVELRAPSSDFELGRILTIEGLSTIELESLIPTGGVTVPLFWIHNATRDSFLEHVERHPAVSAASPVDEFDDRTLFTLDWNAEQDRLINGVKTNSGQLLSAVGAPETWKFELRFPSHDNLSEFTTHCENAQITLDVRRVYNPTKPEAGPWYGLTDPQREAMIVAVEMGYYRIPRECTTKDLAAELGISDQAVTERLRRGIDSLVRHTLVPSKAEIES